MFGTAIRCLAKKPKPKMGPAAVNTPLEQTQTITRTLFDINKEYGSTTLAHTWERLKEVGLKDLTSKNRMKIMLRWLIERQKVGLVSNHEWDHKQFLYSTWFIQPTTSPKNPS